MMPLSMAETGRMNQIKKIGGKEETKFEEQFNEISSYINEI